MKIRARQYTILNASAMCKACGRWTHVIAFALPPEHAVLGDEAWESASMGATVFFVDDLAEGVRARARELSIWYRQGRGATPQMRYWMNHCEHCGASQDDHDLHCEPGGAFLRFGQSQPSPVHRLVVNEAFEGSADGYTYELPN
jgi:hypothetical protein